MNDLYVKNTLNNFPDFCDQRFYGIHAVAGKFEVLTPNIINNDMRWSESISGYTVPDWRRLIREGLNATSPMAATKRKVKANKAFIEVSTSDTVGSPGNFKCTEWKGYPLYAIPSVDPAPVDLKSAVRNAALAKFYAHIDEHRNNSQFGETLGEWRETVRAIQSPLKGIIDFIKRYRKSSRRRLRVFKDRRGRVRAKRDRDFDNDSRNARLLLKTLAELRLEFVFGWIPLVSSVNEAVKAMLDRFGHPDKVSVAGKAGRDYNGTVSETNLFTHENWRVYQGVKTYSRYEHRFKAEIRTGAVNGEISRNQSMGLLPEDWVPTLYELFPWSFVLDYFLQVGDLVNAMCFRRSNIIWGVEDIRQFTFKEYAVPIIKNDPNLPGYATFKPLKLNSWGGDCKTEISSVLRNDILQVSLVPDLYWHLPFNQNAWRNMSALLTAKFARA